MDALQRRYLALRASHGDEVLDSEAGADLLGELRGKVVTVHDHVFASPRSIAAMWDALDAVAFGSRNVLVVGERGTGKEVVAEVIARTLGVSMVAVNCATLVHTLADAELFGVGGGAGLAGVPASGAQGYVEQADGGVLFLDEIFDAPFLFPKLLRLLQQRSYSRVADPSSRPFRGTIVAASNRFPSRSELARARGSGEVRADMVDRFLAVEVPPLAQRREEIGVLADHFLARMSASPFACPFDRLHPRTARALQELDTPWHGNLRELEQLIRTQAQLRRHAVRGESGLVLEIPREDLERLVPAPKAAPVRAEAGDLSAWSREGVRALRRAQLLAALRARMAADGVREVDAAWVAARCRALLGVEGNISEKLRSADLTCAGIARALGASSG